MNSLPVKVTDRYKSINQSDWKEELTQGRPGREAKAAPWKTEKSQELTEESAWARPSGASQRPTQHERNLANLTKSFVSVSRKLVVRELKTQPTEGPSFVRSKQPASQRLRSLGFAGVTQGFGPLPLVPRPHRAVPLSRVVTVSEFVCRAFIH